MITIQSLGQIQTGTTNVALQTEDYLTKSAKLYPVMTLPGTREAVTSLPGRQVAIKLPVQMELETRLRRCEQARDGYMRLLQRWQARSILPTYKPVTFIPAARPGITWTVVREQERLRTLRPIPIVPVT